MNTMETQEVKQSITSREEGRYATITLKTYPSLKEDAIICPRLKHQVYVLSTSERSITVFSFDLGRHISIDQSRIAKFERNYGWYLAKVSFLMAQYHKIFAEYMDGRRLVDDVHHMNSIINDVVDNISENSLHDIFTFSNKQIGDIEDGNKGAFKISEIAERYRSFVESEIENYPFEIKKGPIDYVIEDTAGALDYLKVEEDELVQEVLANIVQINEMIHVCDPYVTPLKPVLSVGIKGGYFTLTISLYYKYSVDFASMGAITTRLKKIHQEFVTFTKAFAWDELPF